MRRRSRSFLAGILAVALLSACGAEAGSGGSTPAPSDDPIVARVAPDVAKAASVPANIGYDVPLSAPLPPGKRLAVTNCGIGACVTYAQAVVDAGRAIGFDVTEVNEGTSVSTITAAWNQIVRLAPDVVVVSGSSYDVVSSQKQALIDQGIPIVWATQPQAPLKGITFTDGAAADTVTADLQGKYILSKTGSRSNVLSVNVPQYASTVTISEKLRQAVAAICSTCPVATLDLDVGDLGNGANVTKIVGYLRSHPDVNFVAGSGALVRGLSDGLQRAGLDGVQIVVWSANEGDLAAIKAGRPVAAVAFPAVEIGWKLVDIAARTVLGDSTEPATSVVIPRPLITRENLLQEPYVPTLMADYKRMWKIAA